MNHDEKTLSFNDVLKKYAGWRKHFGEMLDKFEELEDDEMREHFTTQYSNQLTGMEMFVRGIYGVAYPDAELDGDELYDMVMELEE